MLRPDGAVRRIQRAETLGPVSKITTQKVRAILQERVGAVSHSQRRPRATMTLADFVRVEWRPNAELALKKSSVRYYYNRALAPACDRIKQPRVSWHSFRHTHATQLSESGEPIKTAQALLGHSDLETTLNTYMHVIPDSQRRAVERVAGVLFSDVLKLDPGSNESGSIN
jgi:integrase